MSSARTIKSLFPDPAERDDVDKKLKACKDVIEKANAADPPWMALALASAILAKAKQKLSLPTDKPSQGDSTQPAEPSDKFASPVGPQGGIHFPADAKKITITIET